MSETCRLRQGEGYGVCDDEVVSKCALRERSGEAMRPPPMFPYSHVLNRSDKYTSNCSRFIDDTLGITFSKIAPS
jgi:hypothetical protein